MIYGFVWCKEGGSEKVFYIVKNFKKKKSEKKEDIIMLKE